MFACPNAPRWIYTIVKKRFVYAVYKRGFMHCYTHTLFVVEVYIMHHPTIKLLADDG